MGSPRRKRHVEFPYRSKVLREMYAEARPGRCLICDEPLPPTPPKTKRRTMHPGECHRVYMQLYGAAWRQAGRHLRAATRAVERAIKHLESKSQ